MRLYALAPTTTTPSFGIYPPYTHQGHTGQAGDCRCGRVERISIASSDDLSEHQCTTSRDRGDTRCGALLSSTFCCSWPVVDAYKRSAGVRLAWIGPTRSVAMATMHENETIRYFEYKSRLYTAINLVVRVASNNAALRGTVHAAHIPQPHICWWQRGDWLPTTSSSPCICG